MQHIGAWRLVLNIVPFYCYTTISMLDMENDLSDTLVL